MKPAHARLGGHGMPPWAHGAVRSIALVAMLLVVGHTPATRSSPPAAPELTGEHGVRGFRSGHAVFYTVPVQGGLVLVDTGFDETGEDVRAAVGTQPILAVLLTHSHVDHRSGMAAVGAAPVYVGAADAPLMRGEQEYRAWIQVLAAHLLPRPALPQHLVEVHDGTVLTIGGETFVALAVPGHTPGSTVWSWRTAAFTGDAVGGDEDGIAGPPAVVSEDVRLARTSLSRLWGISATAVYDGHGGRTEHAREKIERYLAHHPEAANAEARP